MSFKYIEFLERYYSGDENDVNPFEMTLAEDDREDQKKRHRMFREKFERINT